jgi:hypothetical protein
VHNLSILREVWDSNHEDKDLLLRNMTMEESIGQWITLQTAFEWQLQQTAAIFEQERRAALAELQERLRLLVD